VLSYRPSVSETSRVAAGVRAPQPLSGDARSAATEAPRRAYFPAFEGLRAIAALLVLLDHTSFAAGFSGRSGLGIYLARGEIGVAVFFLISGFLLYRPFALAHLERRPAPDPWHFLVRRILRIVPLYWFALTVAYALNGWSSVHGPAGIAQTYFFLQIYDQRWALHGISQAWSLDVEVLFYLTLPLLAALVARVANARRDQRPAHVLRVELGALAVLYVCSELVRWQVFAHPVRTAGVWHALQWFDYFALGMALAVLSSWYALTGRQPRWVGIRGASLGCWAGAAAVYWFVSQHVVPNINPLYVAGWRTELVRYWCYGLFALLLLLPAAFTSPADQPQGPVRRLLASRPFALAGLVSYGIYLWHQLVIQQLLRLTSWQLFHAPEIPFVLAVLAVTLVVSTATYVLVERPGIGVGHRWIRRWRERQAGF
jgi:peptidoglycan/LPS O-acetylase OafA/YrhL